MSARTPASGRGERKFPAVSRESRPASPSTPDSASTVGSRRLPTWLRVIPLALPLAILIATGLRGLDFGVHWDERFAQVRPVKTMVETGILLPKQYDYPSFVYWVNGASALPEVARIWDGPGLSERLLAALDTPEFLLRLRAIYVVLSALSLLWVYWLVLRWRASTLEALLAASFLGLSWEVAYHSRWVATDTVLMQFGALTALLAVLAERQPHRPRLLYLAALAAGLGCGTKYPGGLLIVPVLVAAAFTAPQWRALLGRLLRVTALFVGTYLVTTPATILHPAAFVAGVRFDLDHYRWGHAGNTVGPWAEHGMRMLVYFAGVLFSPWPLLALPVFTLCLVGLYAMAREGKTAIVFLSFPVLYAPYFASQRVMIVRNLLVLVPFLSILAARGAAWLYVQARAARVIRLAIAVIVAIVLLMNAGWLVYAAKSVADRRTDRFVREAAAFLSSSSGAPVWISPRLRIHLAAAGVVRPGNSVADPLQAERLVLYASEGMMYWLEWPANRPWLTERWFGPYEVNFNIYPTWVGDDRIVVMSRQQASAVKLLPVAPARFHDSLAAEIPAMRAPAQPLPPIAIHPCRLVSRDDVAGMIGPIVDGPSGATISEARACQYTSGVAVVSLGVFRTTWFELQRPEVRGVTVTVDGADSAYRYSSGPNDVFVSARVDDRRAIMVRVAVAGGPPPIEVAARLARLAVARVRQL